MKTNDCLTAEKWIVKALDEGLAPDERSRLEEHLAECPTCRLMSEATKYALDAVAQDVPADPGEDFWRLYDQSLAAKLHEKELPRVPWWLEWKVAAATVFSATVILSISLGMFEVQWHKDKPQGREIASKVVDELADVYGPIQEERTSYGLSADAMFTLAASQASSNGNVVDWFEVEDESDQ